MERAFPIVAYGGGRLEYWKGVTNKTGKRSGKPAQVRTKNRSAEK